MYQGVYINLDRAVHRRQVVEGHLAQAGLLERYARFAAIDGSTITYGPDQVPGFAALGCTLSHLSVVKEHPDPDLHLHILEDDAVLHPEIPRVFACFTERRQPEEWDVFLTDLFLPPDVYLFKYLHSQYRKSLRDGSISFLDIGSWEFAGASSYFVNGRSKEKFLALMEHGFAAEAPYDLRIRTLARKGLLKVHACFPFFSTLAATSSDSTIAGSFEDVLPLTEYRRSFYVAADLEQIKENLAGDKAPEPDLHKRIYLELMTALMDSGHSRF